MNLRKRKKEPPDPVLSPFDFPIARSYLVDLAMSLPISRFHFPPVPFPCSILGSVLSSVSKFSQICFPPKSVVGVQSKISRFRSCLSSATILAKLCVQTLSGCSGLAGYTRGSSSTPVMVPIIQFRGPRSAIVESSCQGWQIRSNDWDEGKRKRPLVYEEMFYETSFSVLLGFTRDICILVWCIGAGTRPSPYLHTLRAEKRFEACNRVFGAHDNTIDHFTLLLVVPFGVHWSNMIVLERTQFVNDDAVEYLYGCIIHSLIICIIWFLRASEQHLCVLGLCLMALAVHHRMLGQAQQGRCSNRVVEKQRKLPLFYEGTRSFPSFKLLSAEMKLEANKRVFGMQDQVLGTYTLMLWLWFGMYWLYMIEFFHLQFVIDVAVNWLSESFSYLICNCSIWYMVCSTALVGAWNVPHGT